MKTGGGVDIFARAWQAQDNGVQVVDVLDDIFSTRLEKLLCQIVAQASLPDVLSSACQYALMGGKRARPRLIWASVCACGGAPCQNVWRAMVAIECVHVYSLVHDDLPCMDDDTMRRGRLSCHAKFGEAVALLVGDVLQSLAFEVVPSALAPLLATSARRMASGQGMDILALANDENTLAAMHADKTGALIECAVLMGAMLANADHQMLSNAHTFAKNLGLGFQVQDDVLDATESSDVLGKSAGKDQKAQKTTYVSLLGVAGARHYARRLFDQADEVAQKFTHDDLVRVAHWLGVRRC